MGTGANFKAKCASLGQRGTVSAIFAGILVLTHVLSTVDVPLTKWLSVIPYHAASLPGIFFCSFLSGNSYEKTSLTLLSDTVGLAIATFVMGNFVATKGAMRLVWVTLVITTCSGLAAFIAPVGNLASDMYTKGLCDAAGKCPYWGAWGLTTGYAVYLVVINLPMIFCCDLALCNELKAEKGKVARDMTVGVLVIAAYGLLYFFPLIKAFNLINTSFWPLHLGGGCAGFLIGLCTMKFDWCRGVDSESGKLDALVQSRTGGVDGVKKSMFSWGSKNKTVRNAVIGGVSDSIYSDGAAKSYGY